MANAITVGVPLVNLVIAGYLFVSALAVAGGGGQITAFTSLAVGMSAASGIVLATALFWMAARDRRADRQLQWRSPSTVTMVVRPRRRAA